MENHEFSESVKPSQSITHMIETKRSQSTLTRLYCRNQAPENDADIRLYDIGKFQIATQGMQNVLDDTKNNSIGELWVTYQVKFYKPKISDLGTAGVDIFQTANETSNNHITSATPFGFVVNSQPGGSNLVTLGSGNNVVFAPWLDEGYFIFSYQTFCNNTSIHGKPTITDMFNCKLVECWTNTASPDAGMRQAPAQGESSIFCEIMFVIKITGPTVNEQQPANFTLGWSVEWDEFPNGFTMIVSKGTSQQFDQFNTVTSY